MNCKPGDVAYIYCPGHHLDGRFVTVLDLAPTGHGFRLPDGQWHANIVASDGPAWICEFAHPLKAKVVGGHKTVYRDALFAALQDFYLRPIRHPGDDAKDEMLRPLPTTEPAPWVFS